MSAGRRKPDLILIEGRAFSWRALCEARREQLAAWEAAQPAQPAQPALFVLKDDSRPASERSAAGRYAEPTLLAFLQEREG